MMYFLTHRPWRVVSAACLIAAAPLVTSSTSVNQPEEFKANPNLFDDAGLTSVTHGSDESRHYEIVQGFAVYQGDILLGKVDEHGQLIKKFRQRGLGRNDTFGRWQDGIVPYQFGDDATTMQQQNVRQAIDHWMDNTSMRFVERTPDNAGDYPNFLRFDPSNSCASFVGMQGGEQSIMISDACTVGSIIHEIGHAIGLFHEHTNSLGSHCR